jgi:choline-sulfatase
MDAAHRMEHKSTLYDEACRIPLIVRPPGGSDGRVDRSHLVSNGLDLLPTLCDWAGVAPPPGLLGRSLRPRVEGDDSSEWRGSVRIECAIGRGVVTDRYKYAVYDVGTSAEQLTDLARDPHEQRNALGDPDSQEALAGLRRLWRDAFGDAPRDSSRVLGSMAQA